MQLISITLEPRSFSVFSKSMIEAWNELDDLEKGAKHKYVKREPTGKPKPKWRYWYKNPLGGIVSSDGIKVGTSFRHGAGEGKGHYKVTATHDDGTMTIQHDETGHEQKVSVEELRGLLHGGDHEVGEKPSDMFERLKKDMLQTAKTGSKDQQKKMREKLKKFAQGYPFFADQIQDVLSDTAPTVSEGKKTQGIESSKGEEKTLTKDEVRKDPIGHIEKAVESVSSGTWGTLTFGEGEKKRVVLALESLSGEFSKLGHSLPKGKLKSDIDYISNTFFNMRNYFEKNVTFGPNVHQLVSSVKSAIVEGLKAYVKKTKALPEGDYPAMMQIAKESGISAPEKKKSPKVSTKPKTSKELKAPKAPKIDKAKIEEEYKKESGFSRSFEQIQKLANQTPLELVKEYWSKPGSTSSFEKYAVKSGGWWKDTRTGHTFSMTSAMKRDLQELDAAHKVFGKPEPMTPTGGTEVPESEKESAQGASMPKGSSESSAVKKAVADPSKLQLAGSKSTGSSEGRIVSTPDAPNKKFMLKNDQKVKTHAEVAGSQIAKKVLGDMSVAADLIDLKDASNDVKGYGDKGLGCIQEMVPNKGMLPKSKAELIKLPKSVQQDLVASHVANWLVSDADAHGGQYLLTEDGKGAIRIDFGQAYKHIGKDKLDTDYHPNAAFGESKPAPLLLFEAYKEGKVDLDLDDPKIEAAIKKAESIPDSDIREMMSQYADSVESAFGKSKESLIQSAIDRKNNIRKDFKKFFGDLKAARSSVKKSFGLLSRSLSFSVLSA